MHRILVLAILLPSVLLLGTSCREPADTELILATTTSTQDSGLLDVLVTVFEDESGLSLKVIAVGSGAALAMGRSGDADVLLVHSPAAEQTLVADGFGIDRARVMYNDFIIVGPPSDPAGVAGMADAVQAFTMIADASAPFYSRGDDSGTH
ncbi:MAG: substrate-binding domain-containing protein, partial [Dehalococcoidia bacterium]